MSLADLITLQAVELDLRRLRSELVELPRRVAAAQSAFNSAEASLGATRAALAREEALRRSQESDVHSQRDKIARLTRQLDSATAPNQINALDHELTFARSTISRVEDEELASMERTETHEADAGLQERRLGVAAAALAAAQAAAAETTARNQAAVTALDAERLALRGALLNPAADAVQATTPDSLAALALYERVARSRGTGLAEAAPDESGAGQCAACRMRIRPQRWQDLGNPSRNPLAPGFRAGEEPVPLFTCETCGRLLFYDPRRDAPGTQPAIDRLHAAEQAASPGASSGQAGGATAQSVRTR